MDEIYFILVILFCAAGFIMDIFMFLYLIKRKKSLCDRLEKYIKAVSVSGAVFCITHPLALAVRFRSDYSLENLKKTFLAILSLIIYIAWLSRGIYRFVRWGKREIEQRRLEEDREKII